MAAALIHIPEQHAGVPISLSELIDRWASFAAHPAWDRILTADGACEPTDGAWMYILGGLRAGGMHAHVQVPATGRWARIPVDYWASIAAPGPFEGMPGAPGYSDDMLGQPVVVWEGGDEATLSVASDLARMMSGDHRDTELCAEDLARQNTEDLSEATTTAGRAEESSFDAQDDTPENALEAWAKKVVIDGQGQNKLTAEIIEVTWDSKQHSRPTVPAAQAAIRSVKAKMGYPRRGRTPNHLKGK